MAHTAHNYILASTRAHTHAWTLWSDVVTPVLHYFWVDTIRVLYGHVCVWVSECCMHVVKVLVVADKGSVRSRIWYRNTILTHISIWFLVCTVYNRRMHGADDWETQQKTSSIYLSSTTTLHTHTLYRQGFLERFCYFNFSLLPFSRNTKLNLIENLVVYSIFM